MEELKKKILIFIDWFDPAFKAGGPVVSVLNLVEALNAEFEFYIFTGNVEYGDSDPLQVQSDEWIKHSSGATVFYSSQPGRQSILKAMNYIKPDLIYINGLFSLDFSVLPLILLRKFNIPVVIAPRGMLSKGSFSIKKYKKLPFTFIMKTFGFYRKVVFHATGIKEEEEIRKILGRNCKICRAINISVLYKGETAKRIKKVNELRLIFVGRIAPEKNLLFAIEMASQFSDNVKLDIYGPVYDKHYLKTCTDRILQNGRKGNINFCGELERNKLRQKLTDYHLLLLPTTGENFGHAIVESFSSGMPVLISDLTPWINLESAMAGKDIPLADQQAWFQSLEFFLKMDQEEYKLWSEGALDYARKIISDSSSIEQNINMFRQSLTNDYFRDRL